MPDKTPIKSVFKITSTSGVILFCTDTAATMRDAAEQAVAQRANLSRANLSGANLSHANLSHANLSHADLSGAIYRGGIKIGARGLLKTCSRSDGYDFRLWDCGDGNPRVDAGCRWFTLPEAWLHWTQTRDATPLGEETFDILVMFEHHIERINAEAV